MTAQVPGGREADDSIDRYLDRLADLLVLRGRSVRRILCESEDHLRAAVADARALGVDRVQAEAAAIERFGSPSEVARRFTAGENRLPAGLMATTLLSLALVAGIGMLAIGASGGLAAVMGEVAGRTYVAGDAPGVTYSPERCAEFRGFHPEAASCTDAAVAHHFDEVVGYRLDAGVFGAVILAGWYVSRRRRLRAGRAVGLPASYTAIAGAALFGVAAVALTVTGALQTVFAGGSGAGELVSGAVVSAVVAGAFGIGVIRSLRPMPDAPA